MFLRGRPLYTTKSNTSSGHYPPVSYRTTGRSSSLSVVCGESRIGKAPVPIPAGVEYKLTGQHLVVKGPLGELEREFPTDVELIEAEGKIIVKRVTENKKSKAMHGLSRALCYNMFVGVSRGYEKILLMNGVGYRATVEGEKLNLNIGYCHPVYLDIPKGIRVKVEETTKIIISGFDKAVVGNFAAVIRGKRPPEPYKGKGIKYIDEVIKLKDGKRGK